MWEVLMGVAFTFKVLVYNLHSLKIKLYTHGVLYYWPLHRDNWGLILMLRLTWHILIQCHLILFSTNCRQFTAKWHRFIIKT